MKLRVGYELQYEFPQPTPVIMMLSIHSTLVGLLERPDHMVIEPPVPISGYCDGFGNWCSRILAPAGAIRFSTDTVVNDSGLPDPVASGAVQVPVQDLPHETLVFLLASRYCDSDRLLDVAWKHFAHTQPGSARVQAVCDFVHARIAFNYQHASATRVNTRTHTPRFCGLPCSAGLFVFQSTSSRPLRTSWLIVGIFEIQTLVNGPMDQWTTGPMQATTPMASPASAMRVASSLGPLAGSALETFPLLLVSAWATAVTAHGAAGRSLGYSQANFVRAA
jgi:hypothetical protein